MGLREAAASRRRDLVVRASLPLVAALIVLGVAFGAPLHDFARYSRPEQVLTALSIPAAVLAAAFAGRARTRLDRSEQRLRALAAQLPMITYIDAVDASSSSIEISPKVESLLGYPPSDWLDDPDFFPKVLHPEDRDRVLAEHAFAHATRAPLDTVYRLLAKNGDVVWVHDYGTIVGEGKRATLQGFLIDVTNFHSTLEALRLSEERYRIIVENANEGIWVTDAESRTVFANAKLAELLRCSLEQLRKSSLEDFMDEDAWAMAVAKGEERKLTKHAESYEVTLRRADGSPLPILASVAPITDENGGYIGSVALVTDFTDRHMHEQELAAREAKFRAVFEGGLDAKLLIDDDRRYVDVNVAAEQLVGLSRDQLLSSRGDDVFPQSADKIETFWREFLASGGAAGEFLLPRPDGSRVIEYRAKAHVQPGLHLFVLRDVTAARTAEDELRMLGSIVAEANDGVISSDSFGRIVAWNTAAERIYGYTRDEAIGMHISELAPPELRHEVEALVEKLQRGELITGFETRRVRKDGAQVHVSMTLCPLRDRNGAIVGMGGIARDVTAQKQLEAQLRQAQKMEAIGQLAGGVAHDFNNSLMAIRGYAELMLSKLDADDPLRRHADGVRKAAEGAAAVTRQLLAFGRKQMLQPRVMDLNDAVGEMQGMLRRLIGENIDLEFRPGSLGRVFADPGQIEQIVLNLTVNARDAMPSGGAIRIETADLEYSEPEPRGSYVIPAGRYVQLAVTDTGCGIPDAVRDHIFEPFFSTKTDTPTSGSGTGLGLATVYGAVKQSDGFIEVDSRVGSGTRFTVLFPRSAAPLNSDSAPVVDAPEGVGSILLVEDEEPVRELLSQMLQERGYDVLTAASGADAVLALKQSDAQVDALVTDVVMPGMSGPELAMRVERLRPGTRVVYMSGYTDQTVLAHGALNANAPFLQKPFSGDDLAEKLREVLERRGPARRPSKEPV